MRAVVAALKVPFFSIKLPVAYQAAPSYPLPPPTTLIGALAKSYALAFGCGNGKSGDEYVEECIRRVLKQTVLATVKPLSPIWSGSFLLSRLNVLEAPGEVQERVAQGKRIKDAMVRDYFGGTLALVYLFKEDSFAEEAAKALYLLERLGDTESLTSLHWVALAEVEDLESEEGEVDTYFSVKCVETDRIRGSFIAYNMHPMGAAVKVRRKLEDLGEVETYILPLSEVRRGLLMPGKVRVSVRRGCRILRVKAEGFEAAVVA